MSRLSQHPLIRQFRGSVPLTTALEQLMADPTMASAIHRLREACLPQHEPQMTPGIHRDIQLSHAYQRLLGQMDVLNTLAGMTKFAEYNPDAPKAIQGEEFDYASEDL